MLNYTQPVFSHEIDDIIKNEFPYSAFIHTVFFNFLSQMVQIYQSEEKVAKMLNGGSKYRLLRF